MRVTCHIEVMRLKKECVSAGRHSELCFQVLVDHIADADGRDDFEEVGGQASVEPCRTLGLQDLPEEPGHCHLLGSLCRSCRKKKKKQKHQLQSQINMNHLPFCTYNKLIFAKSTPATKVSKPHLVPACGCGPKPEGNWRADHRCWRRCHRPAGRARRGQCCWCHNAAGSCSSASEEDEEKDEPRSITCIIFLIIYPSFILLILIGLFPILSVCLC